MAVSKESIGVSPINCSFLLDPKTCCDMMWECCGDDVDIGILNGRQVARKKSYEKEKENASGSGKKFTFTR
jgi:hypothetical protein